MRDLARKTDACLISWLSSVSFLWLYNLHNIYQFLYQSCLQRAIMFQPSNYEEFTSQLQCDTETYATLSLDTGVMVPSSGAGELVTVDVSGKTFNRMTDYRR